MAYLVIGLQGRKLAPQEMQYLKRPEVGGVILFARNCESPLQVRRLTDRLREINRKLVVFVDQEGGRVQRIGAPLTMLPPLGEIGRLHDADPELALAAAAAHGELMALEVLSLGIDVSLAPVLDVNAGSSVIGDRAFHADPEVVSRLAVAYVCGMHSAGMAACGKHFPGHGSVAPDTHHEIAVDQRPWRSLQGADLLPFAVLARTDAAAADWTGITAPAATLVDALMMAHVCYSQVCPHPAGYSAHWIGHILRGTMGYRGIVISDDLGMRAARDVGGFGRRVRISLEAGCDLVLVCSAADVEQALLAKDLPAAQPGQPADRLRAARYPDWQTLENGARRRQLADTLKCLGSI